MILPTLDLTISTLNYERYLKIIQSIVFKEFLLYFYQLFRLETICLHFMCYAKIDFNDFACSKFNYINIKLRKILFS